MLWIFKRYKDVIVLFWLSGGQRGSSGVPQLLSVASGWSGELGRRLCPGEKTGRLLPRGRDAELDSYSRWGTACRKCYVSVLVRLLTLDLQYSQARPDHLNFVPAEKPLRCSIVTSRIYLGQPVEPKESFCFNAVDRRWETEGEKRDDRSQQQHIWTVKHYTHTHISHKHISGVNCAISGFYLRGQVYLCYVSLPSLGCF